MTESNKRWRDVSRLFHEAVALAPANRAEFLRTACGSDDELRAEIEALLMNDSRAEQFFQVKNPSRSLIGRRIGIYEITSLIGAGGMGEVYRARDTRLKRDVAIKVLPEAFTSDPERLVPTGLSRLIRMDAGKSVGLNLVALGPHGSYVVATFPRRNPAGSVVFSLFPDGPGSSITVADEAGPGSLITGPDAAMRYPTSLSPNGRSLLYSKFVSMGADLMLVENVR